MTIDIYYSPIIVAVVKWRGFPSFVPSIPIVDFSYGTTTHI
jgi:hypothetical protein